MILVLKKDKELLGHLLQDMIAPNEPGSTRTSSLLGSMAYLNNAQPMSWHQIHELSGEIQRQLTKPGESGQIKSSTMRIDSTTIRYLRISPLIGKILILVFALLAIIGLSFYLSSLKPKVEKRDLADMVNIPTGKYPGPYGFHIKVRGFWIDAHEVTIQEYAAFIKAIASLPRGHAKCLPARRSTCRQNFTCAR